MTASSLAVPTFWKTGKLTRLPSASVCCRRRHFSRPEICRPPDLPNFCCVLPPQIIGKMSSAVGGGDGGGAAIPLREGAESVLSTVMMKLNTAFHSSFSLCESGGGVICKRATRFGARIFFFFFCSSHSSVRNVPYESRNYLLIRTISLENHGRGFRGNIL